MKLLKRLVLILLILCLLAGFCVFYAFKIEPYYTVTKRYSLESGQEKTESVRIVQLSDIQVSETYTEKKLQEIVEKVNRLNPDIVLFTGDMYDSYWQYHADEAVAQALSEIVAPLGKFAVWGNRDYGGGASKIYAKLMEQGGFELLNDNAASVSVGEKTLLIGGIDDVLLGKPDIGAVTKAMQESADYKILMLHEPDYSDELASGTANLILAGHSHGGQVFIPFMDRMTTAMGEKYVNGFYDVNEMELYVNSGIGTSRMPVRFLVPPQIAVFDLSL